MARFPTPEAFEFLRVPTNDGFGFHDDERTGPSFNLLTHRYPEYPVDVVENRSRSFAFQDGQLMAKSEIF